MIKLSALNQSPIRSGGTAAALQLVRVCDILRYGSRLGPQHFPQQVADPRALLNGLDPPTLEQVKAKSETLVSTFCADELIILTITHDPAVRQRSYELLAAAWGLR